MCTLGLLQYDSVFPIFTPFETMKIVEKLQILDEHWRAVVSFQPVLTILYVDSFMKEISDISLYIGNKKYNP